MGLLDVPWRGGRAFAHEAASGRGARAFSADERDEWPEGDGLVLADETAVELGNPRDGSLLALFWCDDDAVVDGRITLVGPEIAELTTGASPLRQAFFVRASFDDEYAAGVALKEAVLDLHLTGVTTRAIPSRQTMWLRVSHDALARGFSLAQWAAEAIWRLRDVPGVAAVEVLLVTDPAVDAAALADAAAAAGRLVAAMNKMHEEMDFDCPSCEYWDVCATVEQLKAQRARLAAERREQ